MDLKCVFTNKSLIAFQVKIYPILIYLSVMQNILS